MSDMNPLPRTLFKAKDSLEELYRVDEATYRRFDSAENAFIAIGYEDTGEIGTSQWLDGMVPNMAANIAQNARGRSREDYALATGAATVNYIVGRYGDENSNKQFLKWAPLFVLPFLTEHPFQADPDRLTTMVKRAAKTYGADLVGITTLDPKWVLEKDTRKPFVFRDVKQPTETEEAYVIPHSVDKAVVMAVRMDLPLTLEAPGAGGWTSTELGYSAMGCLAVSLAEYIRALGYQAMPCMNDTALSIPLAVSAGLGQLGRAGMLISPEYGSCLRLCKVFTDMPLNTDHPIDFGVTEFCDQCLLCAKACPAQAISFTGRTFEGRCTGNNPGVEKWYVHVQKCLRFWQANGAPCASCIAACPFITDFVASQCGRCESCVAPDCALQMLSDKKAR